MPALPPINDATPGFRPGIDDVEDAPFDSENPLDPSPDNPGDPIRNIGDYRRVVISLLTQIRDALICDDNS